MQPLAVALTCLAPQAAACPKGSEERMLHIAAFAVSGYSGSARRTNKPFNPLLGETFEFVCQEQGMRLLIEKVCCCCSHVLAYWSVRCYVGILSLVRQKNCLVTIRCLSLIIMGLLIWCVLHRNQVHRLALGRLIVPTQSADAVFLLSVRLSIATRIYREPTVAGCRSCTTPPSSLHMRRAAHGSLRGMWTCAASSGGAQSSCTLWACSF